MSRSAEEWAEKVPWQRLSARSKETKDRIATLIADGHSQEEAARIVGLDTREVARAMSELREEGRALVEGAVLPPLPTWASVALRASLEEHGQLVPIVVDENGDPLDGSNRLWHLREMGVEPIVHVIDTNGDEERRREIRLATNTVRRMIAPNERQLAIEAELTRDPTRSDRAIAAELGVDNKTVGEARRRLEERGTLLRLTKRVGRDGNLRPAVQPVKSRTRVPSSPSAPRASSTKTVMLEARLELDPGDTAGGRLAFKGAYRIEVPEDTWVALGRPMALAVTIAPRS